MIGLGLAINKGQVTSSVAPSPQTFFVTAAGDFFVTAAGDFFIT